MLHGRRGWDRVEGHINDGCDAAGDSCSGSCPETLPIGTAGLVEVYVSTSKVGRIVSVSLCGCVESAAGAGLTLLVLGAESYLRRRRSLILRQ